MTQRVSEDVIRVLVLAGYYLPGERAGGPIRSIANLVEALGDEYAFSIVTRDRDLGSPTPFDRMRPNEWRTVAKATVLYVSDAELTWRGLRAILTDTTYDVLYLNSVLSKRFSIMPMMLRKLRLIPSKPVVIAPRGEFSLGALALKERRKRLFLAAARIIGLYRQPRVTWQASTSDEEADIRRVFQRTGVEPLTKLAPNLVRISGGPVVVTAIDIARCDKDCPGKDRRPKRPGELEAAFLSRISPKKNLLGLLHALGKVTGAVRLDVYGPLEDADYWAACLMAIERLPAQIQVAYRGAVPNSDVAATLANYQLFALPTLGENFGHVVAEALMAGCPVLTTDATPWAEIQSCGAGTIVRGTTAAAVATALQGHIDMDESALKAMSVAARSLAERRAISPENIAQNRALFTNAMAQV